MSIQENIKKVQKMIHSAEERAGRSQGDVSLIAVSKFHSEDKIREAYQAGIRDFGESYIQEWKKKKELLKDLVDIRWHFIGHLQSNKVKYLNDECDYIHSLNRDSLLTALLKMQAKRVADGENIKKIKVFIQYQMDPQDSNKHGASYKEANLLAEKVVNSKYLEWIGFMGMAPLESKEEELEFLFDRFMENCHNIWENVRKDNQKPLFSLGMTGDMDIAIAKGTHMVRVGTGIFGEREY